MKKNNKLNNRGYMLIEIILASSIAFGLAYFMLELTLKLKNKNDDLMVATLANTDNAIISNAIMKYLNNNNISECIDNFINIDGKKVSIESNYVDTVNDYVTVAAYSCNKVGDDTLHITVPMKITSTEEDYSIDLYYKIKDNNE